MCHVPPELSHFPTRRERLAALNTAFAAIPAMWAMVLLILAAAVAMSFTLDTCVLRPLGLPPIIEWLTVFATIFWVTVLASIACVAKYVQRQLRWQLRGRGIELCVACGCRLNGTESGYCPGCGGTTLKPTFVPYPLAIRLLFWAGLLCAGAELFFFFPAAVFAGRFGWRHVPGLLCWVLAGFYCGGRIREFHDYRAKKSLGDRGERLEVIAHRDGHSPGGQGT